MTLVKVLVPVDSWAMSAWLVVLAYCRRAIDHHSI
jgi:hypothetical protein